MVVLPRLNGGRIENRWQPMSALTWCAPSSRSTSFIAEKIGRSGQPVQKPGGRALHAVAPAAFGQRAMHLGGSAGDATCQAGRRP